VSGDVSRVGGPDESKPNAHKHCRATQPATEGFPCAEWTREFAARGKKVAGGDAVPPGPVAARAVSGRAAESLSGRHRCCRWLGGHTDEHLCGCGYRWRAIVTPGTG